MPKFPTLIFIEVSISPRLSNEVLFVGFGYQNAIGAGNLPNFSSGQSDNFNITFWRIFEIFIRMYFQRNAIVL